MLSGDGGCIVARSQEAKQLGIPMGAPFFEYARHCKQYGVQVLAANFSLYADISRRVMQTLSRIAGSLEVYSIDEAFLSLPGASTEDLAGIRKTVMRATGIPVSIGMGSTKTLAKVATNCAKKSAEGVYLIDEINREALLERYDVGEVWGIGRKLCQQLKAKQIHTAYQFTQQPDGLLKRLFGVVGMRIAWELRGISCFAVHENPEPKKSISTAQGFREPLFAYEEIAAILAGDVARVARELRRQQSCASMMLVLLRTSPHNPVAQYREEASIILPEPTAYTPTLIRHAKEALKSIYKEGLIYKKVGVVLEGLVDERCWQPTLFEQAAGRKNIREKQLMQVCDAVNQKFGKQALSFAAVQGRASRSTNRSPRYTTHWEELPVL